MGNCAKASDANGAQFQLYIAASFTFDSVSMHVLHCAGLPVGLHAPPCYGQALPLVTMLEPAHRNTAVGGEYARETGALSAQRWKIGLTLYLLFAGIGTAIEWAQYPHRGAYVVSAYGLQVLLFVVAWWAIGPTPSHPQTGWIILTNNIALSLTLAVYNAAVGGDMLYVLLTYVAIMFGSSVFVPWGWRFQLQLGLGVIGAYAIGLAGGGHVGPVPGYDFVAIAATLVLSTLGARYIEEYRRTLYQRTISLREANRQLEAANQARTTLLSGLSHDMRTPLGVLIGYADMLDDSVELDDDRRHAVRSIRREARELNALVESVVELARLEAGRMPFQSSTFRIADVLEPLRETTGDLVRAHGIHLRWDVPAAPTLHSDPAKVQQIVRNLLSNAVKYTEGGEIALAVAPSDGGIEIRVTDTGIGIAEEHLQRIFDPFQQIELAAGRHAGGSGFGLYMVKLLVQLAGGRIEVHSIPGQGSTFRVWLPPQPPHSTSTS